MKSKTQIVCMSIKAKTMSRNNNRVPFFMSPTYVFLLPLDSWKARNTFLNVC